MPEQTHYDIVELLARKGLRRVVMSPGSRCAPLTIAMVRHPDIETFTVSDERSAAFVALGMSEALEEPVALLCTSGSASVNYYPAITEAFYRGIPLFVMTADRPPELIDLWDGQTIRQNDLYANHILKSLSIPAEADENRDFIFREINWLYNTSKFKSGPVHLNIPLREPLYPAKGEKISFSNNIKVFEPAITRYQLAASEIKKEMNLFQKMMIVVGQMPFNKAVNDLLEHISKDEDAVIVADHTANLVEKSHYITQQDIFLGSKSAGKLPEPDLIITLGKSLLSKKLKEYIRSCKSVVHWQVGENEAHDTFFKLGKCIYMPEDKFLKSTQSFFESDEDFVEDWKKINEEALSYTISALESGNFSELSAFNQVFEALPKRADIHLSNSLPTRYANILQYKIPKGMKSHCNRGTSGIDGCSSTAVGHTLSTERLQILITGDLAFFYDRNAFWHNYDLHNLRIIVLNNHGGGIFRVIKGPSEQAELDDYFDTKQRLSAKNTAYDFGMEYHSANSMDELEKQLKGFFRKSETAKILEIETEKDINTNHFRELMSGFSS